MTFNVVVKGRNLSLNMEVCHHLKRSSANDCLLKGCSNDSTEGVRPRDLGRYRKSYELGGQARSEGQRGLAV